MKSSRFVLLIVGIIVAVLLVRLALYEKKEVPDINWSRTYDAKSTDAYGCHVLREALGSTYRVEDEVGITQVPALLDSVGPELYISIGSGVNRSNPYSEEIVDIARKGGHFLIASSHIGLQSDSLHVVQSSLDSMPKELEVDGVLYPFELVRDTLKSTFFSSTYRRLEIETASKLSSLDFSDGYSFITCAEVGQGKICMTRYPDLLTNIQSDQSYYLPMLNWIVGQADVESVRWVSMHESPLSKSPLQFVFKYRAFRWAYYIVLFSTLVYVFFGGKRRQKIIPLVNKKENTSLEYVDTLAKLHQSTSQPHRIAQRMKENFLYYLESRYFVSVDREDFWEKVAKKSEVDADILDQVQSRLATENIDTIKKDAQLKALYIALQRFKKKAL